MLGKGVIPLEWGKVSEKPIYKKRLKRIILKEKQGLTYEEKNPRNREQHVRGKRVKRELPYLRQITPSFEWLSFSEQPQFNTRRARKSFQPLLLRL